MHQGGRQQAEQALTRPGAVPAVRSASGLLSSGLEADERMAAPLHSQLELSRLRLRTPAQPWPWGRPAGG